MGLNTGYLKADRTEESNEQYTPYYAVEPILKYIPDGAKVWTPFDREWSAFYQFKVKNDLGQERWYSANKFKLFAEAAAYLKEPTAAGTGQGAAQSATPDGAQMIQAADAAAGLTAREGLEIGKAFAAGIAAGIAETQNLNYGA